MVERVPRSLRPVLEVNREGWKTVLGTCNDSVWSVLLQYRGLNRYTLSVGLMGPTDKQFMVGHQGIDYGYYDTVNEAIAEMESLFPKVEAQANRDDIAEFRGFSRQWGVGKNLIDLLATAFTLEALCSSAYTRDIEKVTGIGKKKAGMVFRHFSPNRGEGS